MKFLYNLKIAFLIYPICCSAQIQEKIFYNKDLQIINVSDSSIAEYYSIVKFDSTISTNTKPVSFFYSTGELYSTGEMIFPYSNVEQMMGTWKKYSKNGVITEVNTYFQGRLNGKSIRYRENGNIFSIAELTENKLNGIQVYYHRNKNVMCEDFYVNNEFKSGKCYDSLGNKGPHYFVEEAPKYPGGISAMIDFIRSNIQYPKNELEKKVQGRVYVAFNIDTTGAIIDPFVIKGANFALDRESLRVIKLMPNWIPAKTEGKKVKTRLTVPINFIL